MSSPQPQIQIRTHTVPLQKPEQIEEAEVNISDYLSKEVFYMLLELGGKLHLQNNNLITVYNLFLTLVKQFGGELKLKGVSLMEIEEKMLAAKGAYQNPVMVNDKVFFSPEVKETLLASFIKATENSKNIVQLTDVWSALLDHKQIAVLLPSRKQQVVQTAVPTQPTGQKDLLGDLKNYLEDITFAQKQQTRRPIIDREKELMQMLRVITRAEKNNIVLIGENGVGRSSLISGLAYELINNANLPAQLRSFNVFRLDFPSMIASGEFPGSNISKIAGEMKKLGKLIIYITGLRYDPASQDQYLLNTFLSLMLRDKSAVFIIAADPAFYLSTLDKEPYIKESFDSIRIDEPEAAVLNQIIKEKADQLAIDNKITISEEVLPVLITLSRRYLGSVPFPQKAVTLLDESIALISLSGKTELTEEAVRQVISEKTGIPLTSISVSDREKLLGLEAELNTVVIGQANAVREVVEAIKRSRAGLKDQKKPIGSFLFLGPTGVGKTELAKQLAIKYYNDEKAFVRLDMSEYGEQHTSQRLIGSPPGYTGYEEGGQFTNPILQRPYSLILLDEIEKAHPKIFDIFLQVLDEGRLTDAKGRLADFRNAILIFTSNIGSDLIFQDLADANSLMRKSPKQFYELKLQTELLKSFRPEFINRFDEIIPFNPLGVAELVQIAKLKLKRIQGNLAEKKIALNATDAELEKLVRFSYDPRFGARPIERTIKDKIEDPIAQQIIAGGIPQGQVINWTFT